MVDADLWQQRLALYDALIGSNPRFARKGKTMPYTSCNGHMFSQLNKAGEIGVRLPKASREKFLKTHETTLFTAYGTVMKEYVLIPEDLLADTRLLRDLLEEACAYVGTLKPKK